MTILVGLFSRVPKNPQKKRNTEKLKELRKMIKRKKYDQALKSGTEYLQKVPENHDVLFIVGSIYYMKKKYKTAISFFEKAYKIDRKNKIVKKNIANTHYKLAALLKQKNDQLNARKHMEKALSFDKNNDQYTNDLGALLFEERKISFALIS